MTIDAMGTQTAIAEKIIEKKTDYVLSVKENQPTLKDDLVRSFEANLPFASYEEEDLGYDRIEHRKYLFTNNLSRIYMPER